MKAYGMAVAGVDVGGTNIEVGLVGENHKVLDRVKAATPSRGPDAVLDVIVTLVGSLKEEGAVDPGGASDAATADLVAVVDRVVQSVSTRSWRRASRLILAMRRRTPRKRYSSTTDVAARENAGPSPVREQSWAKASQHT